jgi:hypothetical protein
MDSSVSSTQKLRWGSELLPSAERKYFVSTLTISYFCAVTFYVEKDFTKIKVAENNKQ